VINLHKSPRKEASKSRKEVELNSKIDALTKRLDTLNIGQSINDIANTVTTDSCSICASPMHSAQNHPSFMEQVNAFNDYQKQSNGPYSETYNPGWRNYPNFS
jgi:hypothetical protein